MKKLLAVFLSLSLCFQVSTPTVNAGIISDFAGGAFTVLFSWVYLVAPNNPTMRKNNPWRNKNEPIEQPTLFDPTALLKKLSANNKS